MEEYEKQAQAFLNETGATIEARYVGMIADFFGEEKEKEPRDIYEITIKRGTRQYVFKFGASIADTEKRIQHCLPSSEPDTAASYRKGYRMPSIVAKTRLDRLMKDEAQWKPAGEGFRPNAYSILAAMTKYDPGDDIDEFAAEYGYTKISDAVRVFDAVKKEWQAIRALFNDQEIEKMAEIN